MARATAYRLWIKNLSGGEYVPGGSIENPTFLKLGELKVSRVDLVGKVLEKSDGQYPTMLLEDKTGKIRVRAFGESGAMLSAVNNGDLAKVIGKIRQDAGGRFVAGEIIKKLSDANYALLREKELDRNTLVEEISF